MRYTFSDDEEDSDEFPARRSLRNSGVTTPLEQAGPIVTASGRQVKSRLGGMYGETMLVDQRKELEMGKGAANTGSYEGDQHQLSGRSQRAIKPSRPVRATRRIDYSSEGMNGASDGAFSGNEWSGNEERPDGPDGDEFEVEGEDLDEEMSVTDSDMDDTPTAQDSLVVQLRYKKEDYPMKINGRRSDENGIGAAADCIAVDPGQPSSDTTHLNEEVSKDEDRQCRVGRHFQELPTSLGTATPSHRLVSAEKTKPSIHHYQHQSGLQL